jgi:serine phosphatase RsbU (regulator of sigma subunit)
MAFIFSKILLKTLKNTLFVLVLLSFPFSGIAQNNIAEQYFAKFQDFRRIDTDSAEYYLDKAIESATYIKDYKTLAQAYTQKGAFYIEFGELDTANIYFQKSLSLIKKPGINKTSIYMQIGRSYFGVFKIDSSFKYLNIAKKQPDANNEQIAQAYIGIANGFGKNRDINTSVKYFDSAYVYLDTTQYSEVLYNYFNNQGVCYQINGNDNLALQNFLKGLDICGKYNIKNSTLIKLYYNIYHSLLRQKSDDDALKYLEKAFELSKELGLKNHIAEYYQSIAEFYYMKTNYPDALKSLNEAIKYKDYMSLYKYFTSIERLSNIYSMINDFNNAEKYAKELIDIATKLEENAYLIDAYSNLGLLYKSKGDCNKAIEYFELSIKDEKSAGITFVYDILPDLVECYKLTGNYKKAFYNIEKLISMKDSLLSTANFEKMMELKEQYESEKKEILLKDAEIQNQLQQKQLTKEKQIRYLISGILLIVIIAALISFLMYQKNKQLTKSVLIKNTEIEHKNTELTFKNKEITDSIHYASRIQNAFLPDTAEMFEIVDDGFVYFKPKDIVSGDFYWFSQYLVKKNSFLLATADCTGHGVPGGFMSMLGTSLLNEIVDEKGLSYPAEILNILREKVISALKQEDGFSQDGMDMSIYKIDRNTLKMTYAGANSSIYVVRNGELNELKGDKMPIGVYYGEEKLFIEYNFQLEKGDVIYTFTDGYADQFGGEKGKKMMYKRFEQLLKENYHFPLSIQKEIIAKYFDKWKGSYEQVDDICVIGVKI